MNDSESPRSRKLLGLKLSSGGVAAKGKVGASTSVQQMPARRGVSGSSVVVVTKGRPEAGQIEVGSLTDFEKQKRSSALKLAEENKVKQGAGEPKDSDDSEHGIAGSTKAPDINVGLEDASVEVSGGAIQVNELPKRGAGDNAASMTDVTGVGIVRDAISPGKRKIQNLDNLMRQSSKKEDVSSKKEEPADQSKKPGVVNQIQHVERVKKDEPKAGGKFKQSRHDQEEALAAAAEKKRKSSEVFRKISTSQLVTMNLDEIGNSSFFHAPRRRKKRPQDKQLNQRVERVVRQVLIPEIIVVSELAMQMAEKASTVIKELMKLGVMATQNQVIDADTAELIAIGFGHKVKRVTEEQSIRHLVQDSKVEAEKPRAPVVTIMGHVDHGKTSLLDALRYTDVAAHEHGGITQRIGAYMVTMPGGKSITFLDTPGHEAFTSMRMRGAQVTDIVVLVVAADDGIKAQTIEAINHAKAANVPIIVAINKVDKPGVNINLVKNGLLSHEIIPDDMGGNVMVIPISAKSKIGLDRLEEAILLQAEFLDLKAPAEGRAQGMIIESKVDKGKGVVATFLVQKGLIKIGDIVVAGGASGKVRAMYDDKGKAVASAGPSMPVEILGLNTAPTAGDIFFVLEDEKQAQELLKLNLNKKSLRASALVDPISIKQLFSDAKGEVQELPIVLKADMHGTAEAIVQGISKLQHDQIRAKILHYGIGAITESDISLANTSGAVVIGFNVRATAQAKEMAKVMGIDIQYYSIIYDLINHVRDRMSGMLAPIERELITGCAEIRQVFDLSKYGKVAGCHVTEGVIKRHSHIRLFRDNAVVYIGKLKSLKNKKEDVSEMREGFECGMIFDKFNDIKEKDMIEAFDVLEEVQKL